MRDVVNGIKRERQHRSRRMRPLLLDDIRTILAQLSYSAWPHGVSAIRDAFALLAGFAGAFRRSELAALTTDAVTWHPHDGLHVYLAMSKTDQTGQGATVALPYGRNPGTCVVCAWVRWLTVLAAAEHGRPALMSAVRAVPPWDEWQHVCRDGAPPVPARMPLLRAVLRGGRLAPTGITGDALHVMIKRRAATAGFGQDVGFHSLRAGFVTQARRNGADPRAIRRQTRHGSDAMVEVYDREYVPLAGNAVLELGL